jgi:two-component system NtrC family sensor kinase
MDAGRPGRLVVVEDDLIVRTLLSKRLQGAGHVVDAAGDGREGLDVVRRVQPDLILTDWMMPEMDGPTLITALRADAALRRTYVILLTSKDERTDRVSGLELGADDYLVKPWADDELLAHVRSGLRIQALQRELALAERKSALLTMAATLGHEINNPLTVLAAAILMARQTPPHGGALTEFLERCQRQTDRIAKVVQSLEQLSEPIETNYLGTRSMLELSPDGANEVARPS